MFVADVPIGRRLWSLVDGARRARARPRRPDPRAHSADRFSDRPVMQGLAVLADADRRRKLLALLAAIAALTAVRVWLVLTVCGLPHGLGEVGWVFATLGAFGLLPIGPGGPAGAALAALGTPRMRHGRGGALTD
jgi:hypothetical protein